MVNALVDEALRIKDITEFGKLLHESWLIKQRFSPVVSTTEITDIYNKALKLGAPGGKLLGAGGGGFLLLVAIPELQEHITNELGLLRVPFNFEGQGSQIIFRSDD